MSYIETKTIAGKQYKYLIKAIRENDRIRKVFMKYLGPVDPIYKVESKRKTNASIFARKLSDEEKNKLNLALHSSNAFTRDRAKVILLSNERLFARQIAEKLNCETRKVRKAITSFNKEGLTTLEKKKAKGMEPKFSDMDKKIILIHFSKGPRAFKVSISYWTLPRFRKHLIKKGVVSSISIETLRQILLKAGAKLTKSKRWQYSPDKNFLKKRE